MTDAGEDDGRARYVAIITDGNGRWAKARDLPVVEGHKAGADVVKARLRDAAELGIRELTVYSFSTENWSRPAEEVTGLMRMFSARILNETPELKAEGEASSDDEHRAEVELQKLTDGRVGDLDGVLKAKEEEILAV